MKNFFAKLVALILVFILLSAVCSFSVYAADDGYRIEVPDLTAVPGDTVVIPVTITENAGMMAFSFSLCYDKEAVTFKKYKIGIFNDYLIVDHPENGYISVVNCENRNRTYTGTIFSAEFTVNEKASVGKHTFEVKHIYPLEHGSDLKGCFALSVNNASTAATSVSSVIPSLKNGSVTVGEACSNAGHKFSDYTVTVQPTCTEKGVKSRTCERCGHIENEDVEPSGHDFEDFWTVDKEATDNTAGTMSRHCKHCGEVADEISFLKEDSQKNDFENKVDTEVKKDDNEFIKEKAEEIEEKKEKEKKEEGNSDSSDKKKTPLDDIFSDDGSSSSNNFGIILIAAAVIIAGLTTVLIIILNRRANK